MRTLEKNKQDLQYALLSGEIPIYERDENGNIIYIEVDGQKVPVETGETELGYKNPVKFRGNIAMSGGETEAKSFGVDISDYDAVLLMEKDEIPLDETSILWHTSKVKYVDKHNTIVDKKSADYTIKRVQPSLNFTRYLLKRVVK